MDREIVSWLQSLRDSAAEFFNALLFFGQTMLLPSRLQQIGVALVLALFAWALSRWLAPRVDAWMHAQEGRPKWQLRLFIVLRRRLPLILYVLLIWGAVWVFAAAYAFPSRRYVLVLVATIATAWLGIRLAA